MRASHTFRPSAPIQVQLFERGQLGGGSRVWSGEKGRFIALDDFYPCVTYLEEPRPGQPWAEPRAPQPLPVPGF